MRLGNTVLPLSPESGYDQQLNRLLYDYFRKLNNKVNGIAYGVFSDSADNAGTAAPTVGTYAQGDFVRNSNPTELGTAPNKYVIFGFICVAGGSPGTWVQQRMLTGN